VGWRDAAGEQGRGVGQLAVCLGTTPPHARHSPVHLLGLQFIAQCAEHTPHVGVPVLRAH
jgi:hypothetical protein